MPANKEAGPKKAGQSRPADIILVYPYFYTHVPQAMLFHPLGIARLAACLRERGLNTKIVDCTFERRATAVSTIIGSRPRIIGIYAMLSMSENAMMLAQQIRKKLPEALLVCGGPLPTLKPGHFLSAFDAVFRGEADASFPDFCRDYCASDCRPAHLPHFVSDPEKYPGICLKSPDGKGFIQSEPQLMDEKDINRLPCPDRSDYDHRQYQQFWLDREEPSPASIMTTYGCPFDCEFCSKPVFGNRFRRRHMDLIFKEIRDIKNHGYTGLWIADDCFSLDPEHARSFCRRMISEKLDMKWSCLSRVDKVSPSDIKLWQDAGCRKVFFGLESGSNDILKLMNKKTTTEMAEKTIQRFAQTDIRTAGFFMVGYPGETLETIEITIQWALSLPLDEISFTVPYPLPGTRLYERVMGVDENTDWQYESENRLVFSSDFDETYLKDRIATAYKQFEAQQGTRKSITV